MQDFEPNSPGIYDIGILEPFIHSIPNDDEQHHSMMLVFNLIRLSDYVNDYTGAVGLHSYTENLRQSVRACGKDDALTFSHNILMLKTWDEMAGRDAAMTIFHFGEALAAIRSAMKDTPTIRAEADHNSLREAAKLLRREFPNYELARHAAAHRAEAVASLDTIKKHAVDCGNGKRRFVWGVVVDHTYIATFENRELRVSLAEEARKQVAQIAYLTYAAFPKLKDLLPKLNMGSSLVSPASE